MLAKQNMLTSLQGKPATSYLSLLELLPTSSLTTGLPASPAHHLHLFRPVMLSALKEKLNELAAQMLPNDRTAQLQPFLALLPGSGLFIFIYISCV